MAFAQGSRSRLTYIKEVSFGTTPGSPAMKTLPINTHSLELNKSSIESQEIRSDRQVSVYRHGNKSVSGDIVVEFRPDDFDPLLESAMFNAFDSSNVLEVGTTLKSLSIEDGALDIAKYKLFTGCVVNRFGLVCRPNEMVMATFGMIGKTMTPSGSSVDASPDAPLSDQPFDAFSGTIAEGGSPIAIVSGLELNLENGVQPTFVIGSDSPPQMEYGRARITGTLTAYFEDLTLLEKFVNETESNLEFELASSATGDTYLFELPRIKYSGAQNPLDNEQSRLLTLPFVGLLDSGEGTSMRITKS